MKQNLRNESHDSDNPKQIISQEINSSECEQSILYECSSSEKKNMKSNVSSWMWWTSFGSLLRHLQSGAWLCLTKCACISHQFLGKAATIWAKPMKKKSQVKMLLSSCLILSGTERYEMGPLILVNLMPSWPWRWCYTRLRLLCEPVHGMR